MGYCKCTILFNICTISFLSYYNQIFGYLWHLLLFSNAFFKAQTWQKAEEYIPKQVNNCQHSTAQVIVTGKIRRVLYVNFECLFWPIKHMHSKLGFWGHFSHVQKIGFVAPMLKFPSEKITKTINMLCKHGTNVNNCNVIIS